ncbi:EAL domain-containing protein [Motiliproteus sp. MSK22-1]|uniref:EAL domain-containing protein n=1 Tax=Motiliproteus sp. MSK22-1 TaxID=1897630 RepID=UPI00097727D4|nr:EAL domain-containing protein [Motiliproteus sp. MSK22-1]OMH30418.1 hypothetical protein BGP75_18775 [Motiliproteus sp. MSK22-1]
MYYIQRLLLLMQCLILLFGFISSSAASDLELTPEEKLWLEEHPDIKVGLAIFPPFLTILNEDGQVAGLAVDYLQALEQQLGVSFDRVVSSNYADAIQLAKIGYIDFLVAATPTEERRNYLDFGIPYSFTENLIFTRRDSESLTSLDDFSGLRFAVPAKTALAEYIRNNYPQIQLLEPLDLSTAFTWLSSGYVDGIGADAASGRDYSYKKGLSNIKISGTTGFDYKDSIATRSDWPELGNILNKALLAIPPSQRLKIQKRWVMPEDINKLDRATVKEYSYIVATFVVLGLLIILVWWNRTLKKEIGQRKSVENRLSYLAYHDEVTGILNRAGLFDRLQKAADSGKPYMLLLVGLDHFRVKNELWGQKMGNDILGLLARRVQTKIPEGGSVARAGGDTFAFLLPLSDQSPEAVAHYFLDMFSEPLLLENGTVQIVTATAGIDLQVEQSERLELPLERAEMALKHGKKVRRGSCHLYDPQMSLDIGEDQQWKDDLKMAIHQSQLFLEYQPQLNVSDGRLIGFEALVRWQHPLKGRISPAEFIPYAERLGLISALGDWVLKEACQQAQRWLKDGLEFEHVAVNVSVQQFAEGDFVTRVCNILEASGLPAHYLELEITETFFMTEFVKARKSLESLSELGIKFSIDDFGTGFSSLLYLKQLPVGTIKLAQEFILDITQDSGSYQIVKAATQLGKSLGMDVIAEGIEDLEAQEMVLGLGCEWAQGYYYSRPLAVQNVNKQVIDEIVRKIPAELLSENRRGELDLSVCNCT